MRRARSRSRAPKYKEQRRRRVKVAKSNPEMRCSSDKKKKKVTPLSGDCGDVAVAARREKLYSPESILVAQARQSPFSSPDAGKDKPLDFVIGEDDQADSSCQEEGHAEKMATCTSIREPFFAASQKLISLFPFFLSLSPFPPLALVALTVDTAAAVGRGIRFNKGEIVSFDQHRSDDRDAGGADDGHAAGAASPAARPGRRKQQHRRRQRRQQQCRPVFAALLARGALERELDDEGSKRVEARRWWRWWRRCLPLPPLKKPAALPRPAGLCRGARAPSPRGRRRRSEQILFFFLLPRPPARHRHR